MQDDLKVKIKIDANEKELKNVDDIMKLLGGDSRKTKKDLDGVEKSLTGVGKKGKGIDVAGKGLSGIGIGAKGAVGGVASLTGAFVGLASAMAPALAIGAVIGFGKASLETFGKFEKGMNMIFTLLPPMSKEQEKAWGNKIQNTMKRFGLTAEDTTNAVYNALSAGVPEKNVFSFIENSAKSAKAGGATLDDAAATITTVMNNYRSSNLEASNVSDLLFATIKKGVTTFPELASSIGDVLPSMNSANVSFRETSAMMATLTATMGRGSTAKAGTSMRAMFDELNNSSTQTYKIFKSISGVDFKTFMKNGGDVGKALEMMKSKADSSGKSVADLFSSIEAKKAVNILNDNKKTFDENLESFKNVAGSTDEAYTKMNRGWEAMSNRMKASMEVAMINFGDAIAPIAELLGGVLLGAINLITPAFQVLGDTIDFVLSPLKTLQEAWSFLAQGNSGDSTQSMTDKLKNLSPAAQSVIPALIELKDALSEMWTGITEAFAPLTEQVNNLFNSFTGGSEGAGGALRTFVELVTAGVEYISPILQGGASIVSAVFGVIISALEQIGSFWTNVFTNMGISTQDVQEVLSTLGSIAGAVFSGLGTAITTVWGIIKPPLEFLLKLLGDIVGVIGKISFEGIKQGASAVAGFFGIGGKGNGKKNALGADNFVGGTTTISEQGRELFATPSGLIGMSPNSRTEMALPAGTQIFSNKKTKNIIENAKNMFSGKIANALSGGTTSSVNVTMPINIANATQNQVDRIKSLMPAIKSMIENVLADQDSDNQYRMGAM